jgi:hypothetical protein
MKMFSRSSNDRDWESQGTHKRSESVLSEDTKLTLAAYTESEKSGTEASLLSILFIYLGSFLALRMSLCFKNLTTSCVPILL